MIHYNTSNLSALKMCYIYEEMGIENAYFILELKNPKLQDVDPHSENLTHIQKAMILKEVIDNPWYFFREIVRIPSPGGLSQFEFHRGNIALIWGILNDINLYVVWPRQAYKTISSVCIYMYFFYFGSINNRIVFIAHEDSIVKKNLKSVKDIRDNLPPYLNLYDHKKDRDNEKEMWNSSNNNHISCRAPARNADGARKSGRGYTAPALWFDEIAFTKFIAEFYDSISFAYSKACEIAKINKSRYHQLFTTTAGFLNTDEGTWAYNALNNCADFTELYYDMDIEIVKNVIENSSKSNFLDISFMYYDLGKDENYLEDQKSRLVNSPTPKDTLDREVLNKWKDITVEHPLGQERIERIMELVQRPKDFIIINDTYILRIYVEIDKFDWSKCLIGGMDIGGSLRNDFSTLTIVDPTNFSVVAVMRTNSQSTVLFGVAIVTIMSNLCKGLILFAERNYNSAVIDTIVSSLPNSKRRVYHEDDIRAGIFNSKNIRYVMFNVILRLAVDDYGDRICDKNIIDEIVGLIRTKSGRIDHKPGKHDDTLISYLLSLYFLLYIEDKGKYMDISLILSDFVKNNFTGLDKKEIQNKMSNKMKRIIGQNYEVMMKESNKISSIDDIANIMYESNNRKIDSSIDIVDSDIDNMDDIEMSDNLGDIDKSIGNIKDNNKSKKVHIDIQTRNTSKDDFNSFFGKNYFRDDFSSIFN